ncbi:uncharacterized protein METZ01_LOCUS122996, partial [marine metagenome]
GLKGRKRSVFLPVLPHLIILLIRLTKRLNSFHLNSRRC